MRCAIVFLFCVFTLSLDARVLRVWVNDTNFVTKQVWDGDTVYLTGKLTGTDTMIMYYDSALTHKAKWIRKTKSLVHDSVWFRNGKLKEWTLPFDDCFPCLNGQSWYPSGVLERQITTYSDSSVSTHYYPSGQLSKKEIGIPDPGRPEVYTWHYLAEYYENGQLMYDPIDPNGPRKRTTHYYENGNKKSESYWGGFFPFGDYVEWFENGQLKIKGQYDWPSEDGLHQFSKKIGTWSYYNESGKLVKEEFYEEGKLIKTTEY